MSSVSIAPTQTKSRAVSTVLTEEVAKFEVPRHNFQRLGALCGPRRSFGWPIVEDLYASRRWQRQRPVLAGAGHRLHSAALRVRTREVPGHPPAVERRLEPTRGEGVVAAQQVQEHLDGGHNEHHLHDRGGQREGQRVEQQVEDDEGGPGDDAEEPPREDPVEGRSLAGSRHADGSPGSAAAVLCLV